MAGFSQPSEPTIIIASTDCDRTQLQQKSHHLWRQSTVPCDVTKPSRQDAGRQDTHRQLRLCCDGSCVACAPRRYIVRSDGADYRPQNPQQPTEDRTTIQTPCTRSATPSVYTTSLYSHGLLGRTISHQRLSGLYVLQFTDIAVYSYS